MARLFIFIFPCFLFLLSCRTSDRQKKSDLSTGTAHILDRSVNAHDTISRYGYLKIDQDSVTVLPFEIDVILSPKAKDKITSSKETLIISVSLTGTPRDTTLVAEDGQFYVASSEKEINYGQVAMFDHIRFSRKTFDQLADKNVYVIAFVYSGRKSSADNLLNCGIVADSLRKVVNKKFIIKGKLIYGDD